MKKGLLVICVLLFIGIIIFGLNSLSTPKNNYKIDKSLNKKGLKDLMPKNIKIGSQFNPQHISKKGLSGLTNPYYDERFDNILKREFNLIIPGNDFKMNHLQPSEGKFDFRVTDLIVEYAEKNNFDISGHVLIYPRKEPYWYWIRNRDWTRDELIKVLKNHIKTVVSRYKGRVDAWDVINEIFCDSRYEQKCDVKKGEIGGMDNSIWYDTIGPEMVEIALNTARKADPNAILYINENGWELIGSPKAEKFYSFVKDLVKRNIPLDGVGIQMHISLDNIENSSVAMSEIKSSIAKNFKRFNDLGLQVRVTEIDVRIPKSWWTIKPTAQQLKKQADIFKMALEVCLEADDCPSFNMWGFTDKYSWINEKKPGYGFATIFDKNYNPKSAYFALKRVLIELKNK